jgi:hypothetical protein
VRPVRVPFVVRLGRGLGRELRDGGDGGGDFGVDGGEMGLLDCGGQLDVVWPWKTDSLGGGLSGSGRASPGWSVLGLSVGDFERRGRALPVQFLD